MGEIGEALGKFISRALARELARNPFFAEYEWPILLGIGLSVIAAVVLEQRASQKKKLTSAVAPKRDTKPQPSRHTFPRSFEQFLLPISLKTKLPLLLSTVALVVAIFGDMPYDFFELLRVLVFVTSLIVIAALWKAKILSGWMWLAFSVAILYNPLMTIHLHRDTWVWINIATVIMFVALIASIRGQKSVA